MANPGGTAAQSHDLHTTALEADIPHVVGRSRAFLHELDGWRHEIGSLHNERAARLVEALEMAADPGRPGSVGHLEQTASALLRSLRERE